MQPDLLDPAGEPHVQHREAPEHDDQRAIFLRIPSPEAAPGIIPPDTAEDGADQAENETKTENQLAAANCKTISKT